MYDVPMFINGAEHRPVDGAWFESDDPYTGKPWAQVALGTSADVDLAVGAASAALEADEWGGLTATARGALLVRLADVIASHADELAQLEVNDNGKLLAEMAGQVAYVPQWFRYFGGLADKIEGRVLPIDKPATSPTPGASRWASPRSSRRGTRRCSCWPGSWHRRWPRVAP